MRKTILITGATDGIGKQIAYQLANMDQHVIIHGRNIEKCQSTKQEILLKIPGATIDMVAADFSSLANVKKLAENINQDFHCLDVLINNAGVYASQREISADGFEMNLAVNYLATYVLTKNLEKLLITSTPSRIINVSSITHKRGRIELEEFTNPSSEKFDGYKAYADSKLMMIYFTYCLADDLLTSGVTVNALHPGVITTKMLVKGFNMQGEDVMVGAETPVFLAISPEVENMTGKYFDKKLSVPSSRLSYDLNQREQAMMWTKKAVKNFLNP